MTSSLIIARELRALLRAIIPGTHSEHDLRRLVRLSHAVALPRLRMKTAAGSLRPDLWGIGLSDLAFDLIAELFQKDDQGTLIRVKTYFEGVDIDSLDDERLLVHFRRLIFATVNQSLVRVYREFDPGLSRILRNIGLAVQSLGNFVELERFGERCIAPSLCPLLDHLEMPDAETLCLALLPHINGHERIPDTLSRVALYLREQDGHARIVPVVTLAVALRRASVAKHTLPAAVEPEEVALDAGATEQVIRETCSSLEAKLLTRYLRQGKVTREEAQAYSAVVRHLLRTKLADENDGHASLYRELSTQIPGLSEEQYRARHRGKLEYLLRLAQREVARRLREG
jgi:hypothetical protein